MDGWMDGWKVASSACLPACKLLGIVTYGTVAPPATTWPKLFVAFGGTRNAKIAHPTVPAAMQFTLEYKMLERG